ncbi:uncharacterized protein LOC144744924 [Ciona intestinalis]
MEAVKSAADNGNDDHQLNCYGTVFPENCDTYYGPHSVECLTTIWESKGCLSEGTKAPVKLDKNEKDALDLLNVDQISSNFQSIQMEADGGDKDKGLECYGIGLYVECLTTIWEWKGCLGEGTKAPIKLVDADKEAVDLLTVE